MVKITNKIKELGEVLEKSMIDSLVRRNLDCEGNINNARVKLICKKKYVYVNVGSSGHFLVDKDERVYTIRGYGQKGCFVGLIEDMITIIVSGVGY